MIYHDYIHRHQLALQDVIDPNRGQESKEMNSEINILLGSKQHIGGVVSLA